MTLLRLIRGMPDSERHSTGARGRRLRLAAGHQYGPMLIDVESRRLVDVLTATRRIPALRLREHPGVEVVCRDGAARRRRCRSLIGGSAP